MKVVEIENKKVYIESLKFKDFVKFTELINEILEDAEKNSLNISKYLEKATPLISAMSNLKKEEIEELKASQALRILKACIEVIKEDEDFLEALKETLQALKEFLSTKR